MDLLGAVLLFGYPIPLLCLALAWILVIEGPELKKKRGKRRYVPQYRFPVLPGIVMLLQVMLVSATFGVYFFGLVSRARELGSYGEISVHSTSIVPFLRVMPFVYGVAIFFAALLAAGFRLIGKSFAAGVAGDRS